MSRYQNSSFKALKSEFLITEGDITQKVFGKETNLKWHEITKAELTGDSDMPGHFKFLYLGTKNKKNLLVPINVISNYREFLADVLRYLPANCEIDPHLHGVIQEGDLHQSKTFLKIERKSLLGWLVVLACLGFLAWLLLGLFFNYWQWSI